MSSDKLFSMCLISFYSELSSDYCFNVSCIDSKYFISNRVFEYLLSFTMSSMSNTESLTSFLMKDNFKILASIDYYVINLMASTYFFCPILWTLPTACSYMAGFHQGSIKNTLLAASIFNPTDPIFSVRIRIFMFGFVLNYLIFSCLDS